MTTATRNCLDIMFLSTLHQGGDLCHLRGVCNQDRKFVMPAKPFQYGSYFQQTTSDLLKRGKSHIGPRVVGRPHDPARGVVANQSLMNAMI